MSVEYIKVPYSLFKSMVLEAKEKDNQIFEQERDYRMLQERLEDEEAAHAALKEKYGQGR